MNTIRRGIISVLIGATLLTAGTVTEAAAYQAPTPATANGPGLISTPGKWKKMANYLNLSECNKGGRAYEVYLGLEFDCRPNGGTWDLWVYWT
ncbi:hypothetical protein [Actinomadura terrae]|uniref:hypothetical protein n=1 Tax=Actinomadura terrae TaxID=604353 RepID=UPI001FA74DF8|nr:hypothetical protein [Actinomadura terrae]